MGRAFLMTVLLLSMAVMAGAACAELKVERVWDGPEILDVGYVLVTYRNSSYLTYDRVEIRCVAFTKSGKKINVNDNTFYSFSVGPIETGFERTVRIGIDLHGMTMDSARCRVHEYK